MLDYFFLCQNFGWRYRRGRKKKHLNSVPFMGSKELKSYFTYISFCKGDFKGDEALSEFILCVCVCVRYMCVCVCVCVSGTCGHMRQVRPKKIVESHCWRTSN